MKYLITLIAGISQFYHTTTIVIDGLDECHLELRQPLLEFVSSIQLLETTRILVLSRPEADIEDELQSFPTVSLEKEEINLREDMQVFIEKEFEDKKKWGTDFQELRNEIIEALILGSGKNMWVDVLPRLTEST
jgi:hypothetical protein